MRTRIFNKMTHTEVQSYLDRGGDTMYIAIGAVEVHGAMPIDCEVIFPEAAALEMAERSDGLAMINLPYYFAGGTVISNATVQMSVRDGIDHLMSILRSLVGQGFRKLIFVTGHAPSRITIDAVSRDFFEETKIHVCHINTMSLFMDRSKNRSFDKMICGAYLKMNQMEYLPVDPNGVEITPPVREKPAPWDKLGAELRKYGGSVSLYYEFPEDHFGGRPFFSEEERRVTCEEGLKQLQEAIAELDLDALLTALDEYHDYVWNVALPKYPRLGERRV